MKKITKKMWGYSINFLLKTIVFNLALAFAITALVYHKDGFTIWAIISLVFVGLWLEQEGISHLLWHSMARKERALWLALRHNGSKVVKLTNEELDSKGQKDIKEFKKDDDFGLEVKMIINGTGTLINLFIGIKWFIHARMFNKTPQAFEYSMID